MSMTYAFERKVDRWDTEPDFFDLVLDEDTENEKIESELSLEDLANDELAIDESEFDL